MSSGRIGLSFSVNNFPVKKDFDIRINVKEDFNFLRYGSSFGLTNVGVSFIDSDPINVSDNLIIKDLTSSVPENSPLKSTEDIYFSQILDLPNAKFLITDVFKTTSLGEEIAMYLRHSLDTYAAVSNIEVLDGNFQAVNADLYMYIDEEATLGYPHKSIYTNLNCIFDSQVNRYTLYYIRFKDETTGAFITEILNSKPFYSKTTFSTQATDRAYSTSPLFGLSRITIHFDSKTYSPTPILNSHRFSLNVEGDNRIAVVPPSDLPATDKWYLRINPGEFYKNTVDGDARYYVPEYEEQLFSPVSPFKLLVEKRARIINSRTLYLEPKPIANLNATGFYLYIVLRDRFGTTKRALTNDPSASIYTTPSGVITDVFFEKASIDSVAENDGFIRLSLDIDTDLIAYVSYRYVEDYYLYRGISVNSTINPRVLNNRILVYIKPEFTTFDFSGNPISDSILSKTIFHLLIDESNLILSANESDGFRTVEGLSTSGNLTTLSDTVNLSSIDVYTDFEIEILSGPNSGRKLKISSYNTLNKTLTVAEPFESAITAGIKYRINKKINDYEYLDPISSTLFNYSGWIETYTGSPNHYVLLSDVFAIQTLAPKNIDVTDIRIRGGGIKKDQIANTLKLQDEVQWYWDVGYWDGQPYPGMGAMIVELPRSILKEVGGDFSKEQVQSIVERHTGNGTYVVIKYYDRSTKILDVQPGNNSIYLEWLDIEASSYNVYLGQNPDQMPLHRSVAGVLTNLTIDSLDNDKIYYVMVEAVFNGIPQLPSRKAFAIPFNPTTAKPPAIYGETGYSGGSYSNG